MGAFITIAAVAASTLTQQMVVYLPRMSPSASGKAIIPVTQVFSPRRPPAYASEYSAGYEGGVNVRNAIFVALWTNSTTPIQPLEPVCSTGNCSWPTYRSLGICAQMADVSNLITDSEDKSNNQFHPSNQRASRWCIFQYLATVAQRDQRHQLSAARYLFSCDVGF